MMAAKTPQRAKPKSAKKPQPKKRAVTKAKKPDTQPKKPDTSPRNPVGRPRIYETPEELEAEITAYFASLDDGENVRPPTMAGLALFLGFANRHSLFDYKMRSPEFSHVMGKAIARVERHHEERLSGTTSNGSVFWLKNHGAYKDQVEHSGPGGGPVEIAMIRRVVVESNAG